MAAIVAAMSREPDMNAPISTDNARRFLAIGFCGMAVFCAFVVASLVA
jgi:hypothetical protein